MSTTRDIENLLPGAATGATLGSKPLRELDQEEFLERYRCDRFTATILANRFRYVVSHMCAHFRSRSFSPVVRDVADLVGTLSGGPALNFDMAAVSETLPLFYGSIPDAVRIALEEYGVEQLVPGDVVLVNDYYRVGTHFNDACCIRPVFYEGVIVGVVTIRAHVWDIGGIVAGGFECTKANIWEDGLRIPPTLLYSAGEPVRSTLSLLYDNTRYGEFIVPDLQTEILALELGEQLVLESIEKYGLESYMGAIRYVCDASAEAMSDALERLPDGVYDAEEWLDGDGLPDSEPYKVRLQITKVGDRAEFDLRGSSPASRTAVNCAWPDIKTGISMALKVLLDPRGTVTSGTLRNVDVVVPPDAIFNPQPPHACMFYDHVVMVIFSAVHRALNPVLGEDARPSCWYVFPMAAGTAKVDGRIRYGGGLNMDAWGADKDHDGESGQQGIEINMTMMQTEITELDNPTIVSLSTEYITDSGGPGANRGGAASLFLTLFRRAADYRYQELHARVPLGGGGVYGGKTAPTPQAWLWHGEVTSFGKRPFAIGELSAPFAAAEALGGVLDPATNEYDPNGTFVCPKRSSSTEGAVLGLRRGAGDGWGDPYLRDPDRVLDDVRNEYVSVEGARRDYGVVVVGDPIRYPEMLGVDLEETERIRSARIS